jgi:hypothetical protein
VLRWLSAHSAQGFGQLTNSWQFIDLQTAALTCVLVDLYSAVMIYIPFVVSGDPVEHLNMKVVLREVRISLRHPTLIKCLLVTRIMQEYVRSLAKHKSTKNEPFSHPFYCGHIIAPGATTGAGKVVGDALSFREQRGETRRCSFPLWTGGKCDSRAAQATELTLVKVTAAALRATAVQLKHAYCSRT